MGYKTNQTHTQRNFISENFPEIFRTKLNVDIFEILNALFFLIKTGCQWKLLPNDFPRCRTVYEFYRKWTSTGFFDRLTEKFSSNPNSLLIASVFSYIRGINYYRLGQSSRICVACFGHDGTPSLPHCANTAV